MRPQSALQSKTVLFNQFSGQYYTLGNEGEQIKVNKRGDLATKFTKDFTGFLNYKQRKFRSLKDKALMYTEPKLNYDKENGFICPKGSKFLGYAQQPYNLKGELLQFLGGNTFKQTCETKNQSKSMKTKESFSLINGNITEMTQQRTQNKFKSLKILKTETISEYNFELINDKFHDNSRQGEWNSLLKTRQTKEDKFEKSIIMRAGENYKTKTHKRARSTNVSSAPSLHKLPKTNNSIHQKTYFEQSLSNIQRTENPNYFHSDFTYGEFGTGTFNQPSLKAKCYKTSCHSAQYMPRQRYVKGSKENNMVNIGKHKVELEAERREKELVDKLKDGLKVYQPVVEVQVKKEEKRQEKDKGKKPVQTIKK